MNPNLDETQELEELIASLGSWILEDESVPGLLNVSKMAQLHFSHRLMQKLAQDSQMQVQCKTYEPFKSIGSIIIKGDQLEFSNCKWLGRAMEFASNVEVYPLRSGGVRLALTFHGLTAKMPPKATH